MKCKPRKTFLIKMNKYPFWSYLNISAIDAPLISVTWYLYFAHKSAENNFNVNYCIILGLSVWLGYMADRLLDIGFKKEAHFTSLRHQFCKEFKSALWISWAIVLTITVFFSLYYLNSDKIFVGFIFFLFILLYNLLNQFYSQLKLPKEIFVSILFAYGTLFFVKDPLEINEFIHFVSICFLNCLIISNKDKQVDKLMGVRSLASTFSHGSISVIMVLSSVYYLITFKGIMNPFFTTCLVGTILHSLSNRIASDKFIVTTEIFYILIPLMTLV